MGEEEMRRREDEETTIITVHNTFSSFGSLAFCQMTLSHVTTIHFSQGLTH